MFQDGRMDKQIVVYVYNGIFGKKKKKERNLDICKDMDGPSGHYAK